MPPSAAEFLNRSWSAHFTLPDTREIYDWAAQEVELPSAYAVTGRFDASLVPFVKEPFHALRNPRVREVICESGVQCLKTLIGEIWLLHTIVENPGPTQWVQPTDEEAREHCEERFNFLLDSCPAVKKFFNGLDRHSKKIAVIIFKHMWLRMEGAGKGNAQRKSVKNQMCSEIWQADKWVPGRLKDFAARLTQFTFNSKRYIESQAGWVGDEMDVKYKSGTQKLWHVACQKCGFYQPLVFGGQRPDGSRHGMIWSQSARRDTGASSIEEQWNWNDLRNSIRYECVSCAHGHTDDPLTRRRFLASGNYVSMRAKNSSPSPPSDGGEGRGEVVPEQKLAERVSPEFEEVESFKWNQLTVANLNWFQTQIGGVKNFLIARDQAKKGFTLLQQEFFQKVLAEPYDADKFAYFSRIPTIELSTPVGDKFWERQDHILMGVDVQATHMWVLVEAFSKRGDSMTLWAGKCLNWSDIAEKQAEYKIPDQNVSVDVSHRWNEVIRECCRHGHWETSKDGKVRSWKSWKAFRGDDKDYFLYTVPSGKNKGRKMPLPYSWPPQIGDPCVGLRHDDPTRTELTGRKCPIIHWSNPTIKDVVIRRRDNLASGVETLCADGDWVEEFSRQMDSQKKVQTTNTLGQTKWRYQKFRDDHLFDCRCMNITRAFMLQIIGEPIST